MSVLDRTLKRLFSFKLDDIDGRSFEAWLSLAATRELSSAELESACKRGFLEGVGPIRIREQLAEAEGVRADYERLNAKPCPASQPSERDEQLEKLWADYSERMKALRAEGAKIESEMNQRKEARLAAFNADLHDRSVAMERLRVAWRANRERYRALGRLFVDPRPAGHPEAEVIEWVEVK